MSGNRRNDQNNDVDRDNGPNFFGLALAGAGIGAMLYGASKLFSSDDNRNREPERVYAEHGSSETPSVIIKVIKSEQECVSAIDRIER